MKKAASITAQLANLNEHELRRLLVEQLTKQKLGIVWEHSAIERDRALNADVVLPRLREDLSCRSEPQEHVGLPYRNLIIEGDNFDALRMLRATHANKVDIIYIDPPYNTGNKDWVYNDRFVKKTDRWRHSMWLEYMHQRLLLAKDLLAPNGVIFCSIDDNEGTRLGLLLDEVFGGNNHIATFIWRKVDSPNDNKPPIAPDHEYIFCYGLEKDSVPLLQMPDESIVKAYGQVNEDGRRYRDRLLKKNGKDSLRSDRETMWYPIEGPDGVDVYPIHDTGEEARWACSPKGVEKHRAKGTLIWKQREKLGKTVWEPYSREWAPVVPSRPYPTIWSDMPTMRQAKKMLRDIFKTADLFNTPKPVELIQRMLRMINKKDAVVLDFYAGSGTTGHAVLRQNAEDGGTRRFIMVSSKEATDLTPTKNVCRDICAERMRVVIKEGFAAESEDRVDPLPGDFAYLELDKIDPADVRMDATEEHAFQMLGLRTDGSARVMPVGPVKLVTSTQELAVVYLPVVNAASIKALLALPQTRLAVYSSRPQTVAEKLEESGKTGNSYAIGHTIMAGQALSPVSGSSLAMLELAEDQTEENRN